MMALMSVVQVNRNKVRPVLDYRGLNEHVSSHMKPSDDADKCSAI